MTARPVYENLEIAIRSKHEGGAPMIVLCREVDKNTGKIMVYPLRAEVTDRLLHNLSIRSRINPELRYFVTTKSHWEGFSDIIICAMKRKQVTNTTIERLGGIVEL